MLSPPNASRAIWLALVTGANAAFGANQHVDDVVGGKGHGDKCAFGVGVIPKARRLGAREEVRRQGHARRVANAPLAGAHLNGWRLHGLVDGVQALTADQQASLVESTHVRTLGGGEAVAVDGGTATMTLLPGPRSSTGNETRTSSLARTRSRASTSTSCSSQTRLALRSSIKYEQARDGVDPVMRAAPAMTSEHAIVPARPWVVCRDRNRNGFMVNSPRRGYQAPTSQQRRSAPRPVPKGPRTG